MTFDADTLRALRDVQETVIRTEKHPKSAVVIWVVVSDDKVFVRSWLGARGRWYRISRPVDPRRWSSPDAGCRCKRFRRATRVYRARTSSEILRKYRHSSHAQEMVRDEILPTTLRLEPR